MGDQRVAPCEHGEWSTVNSIETVSGVIMIPGEGRTTLAWGNATLDAWFCNECTRTAVRINQ